VFDIPVVLFLFKRKDTLERILGRIRSAAPKKIYLIADGARTSLEKELVGEVRRHAEALIDWDCEIVKNYADENRGVYDRIGVGARWVLEKEDCAIFLEDDNLPEVTFFEFCSEMLSRYQTDARVLWICGTNYLGSYDEPNGASYVFTRHLLPCGWATWSSKFRQYYDGDLDLLTKQTMGAIESTYSDKRLYYQDRDAVLKTRRLLKESPKLASWDRQMLFSLRHNGLYGISPNVNQIMNIGVDLLSTHGGTSLRKTMTKRFCEIPTKPLTFPLTHPSFIIPDPNYEKLVGEIALYPKLTRIIVQLFRFIKPLIGLRRDDSLMLKIRKVKDKHSDRNVS